MTLMDELIVIDQTIMELTERRTEIVSEMQKRKAAVDSGKIISFPHRSRVTVQDRPARGRTVNAIW